jgi:hypothetical protein
LKQQGETTALLDAGEGILSRIVDRTRRPALHVLFVALGAAHHLSAGEVAAARTEMKQWHYGNRDLSTIARAHTKF